MSFKEVASKENSTMKLTNPTYMGKFENVALEGNFVKLTFEQAINTCNFKIWLAKK